MKFRHLFGVSLLSFACVQANAQQILGIGTGTCATFTKAIGTPSELWYESWAFGFLSSLNYVASKKDILKGKDPEAISAAIKLACEKNPLNQFGGAVLHVAGQLRDMTPDEPSSKKK